MAQASELEHGPRPAGAPTRLARAWRVRLVALLLLLFAAPALFAAPGGAAPNPDGDATVRLGTTALLPGLPLPEQQPRASQKPAAPSVSDAPELGADLPPLPSPPASFNTYDGGWIRFAYPPGVRERVQPLIAGADDVRAELKARLGQAVLERVTVHVARTPGEMTTLAPEGAPYPKYASGVAYSQMGLVLLTIAPLHPGSQHDLEEVFRHELAHVALFDAVEGRAVPRWFNEGFAVFASGESSFSRLQSLWTATLADKLIPLERLDRSFPADDVTASVAYAEAADVVRFLVREQDRHRFSSLVERVRKGQSFEKALEDAYGTDVATLEFEWREDVARRYTFWPVFFSGGFVWMGALGLFAWGWRRRRRRDKATLARWEKEEAVEDDSKRRRVQVAEDNPRVHIVLARSASRLPSAGRSSDADIPKVEHDGRWHTLH